MSTNEEPRSKTLQRYFFQKWDFRGILALVLRRILWKDRKALYLFSQRAKKPSNTVPNPKRCNSIIVPDPKRRNSIFRTDPDLRSYDFVEWVVHANFQISNISNNSKTKPRTGKNVMTCFVGKKISHSMAEVPALLYRPATMNSTFFGADFVILCGNLI